MSTTALQSPQRDSQTATKMSGSSRYGVLPPISSPLPPIQGKEEDDSKKNPFILPPANEVFTMRERERLTQREERAKERNLKVHEKMTYSTRMNCRLAGLRKQVRTPDSEKQESKLNREARFQEDTQLLIITTKDRHLEKEDITSYVGRKREMFLVQYSLGVKKEEIHKLEEIAKAEEKKLEVAEKYLEQSATMFDEFLKENDKNAVEAIKMAETASKSKLEKVAEIKRLNSLLIATKNEISRNNDLLLELQTYKNFLDSLGSQDWREHQKTPVPKVTGGVAPMEEVKEEEEVELYFTEPSQLINIFTELEEMNLSLIQNSQETQVTLEEMKQNRQLAEERMNKETENLKRQIDLLKNGIVREEEKASDLEIKINVIQKLLAIVPHTPNRTLMHSPTCNSRRPRHGRHHRHVCDCRMYSYGEYKAEDQEQMLLDLNLKVSDVYAKCVGTNEANIQTLQMLAAIENRLEDLFETVETLPSDKIEAAEKSKEKERRIRQREEKLEEQRVAQEERLRRALERAQADPKKRVGRKLVYRSEPPVLKRKQEDRDEKKEKEEEEMQYFFS